MAEKAVRGAGADVRGVEGRSDARTAVDASMSEAQWQAQVVAFAEAHNWVCWHDNDSRRNDSGFPDLVLIRHGVIWVELKKVGGRVSPVQRWFHDVLRAAGEAVYVWYPTDWPEAQRVLKGDCK